VKAQFTSWCRPVNKATQRCKGCCDFDLDATQHSAAKSHLHRNHFYLPVRYPVYSTTSWVWADGAISKNEMERKGSKKKNNYKAYGQKKICLTIISSED